MACADRLEVWPQFSVPVARVGHLLALKLLSRDDRRLQDQLVGCQNCAMLLTCSDDQSQP